MVVSSVLFPKIDGSATAFDTFLAILIQQQPKEESQVATCSIIQIGTTIARFAAKFGLYHQHRQWRSPDYWGRSPLTSPNDLDRL